MEEITTPCPECGFPSLGPRIRPHNCERRKAHPKHYGPAEESPQPIVLATPSAPPEDEDAILAAQINMQWERAVRGEAEQHIFGAMMIMLERVLSTRGQNSPRRGPTAKGKGVEAWLKQHNPKVKRPTALRWRTATEGLLAKSGIGDPQALKHLLSSPEEALPEPERLRQTELFSMLEKSSQSELIEAAPYKRVGGKTYERDGIKGRRPPPPTFDEQVASLRAHCIDATSLLALILHARLWRSLEVDAELDRLIEHCEVVAAEANAWRRKTKSERLAENQRDLRKELGHA
jgi:hypothetical protein